MSTSVGLVPGTFVVGRYRVNRFLGAGTFGAVYSAEHRAAGVTLRTVALKLLGSQMLGTIPHEMLREAVDLMRLVDECRDPFTRDLFVNCYDAGLTTENVIQPFIAMELVQGSDLRGRIGQHGIPVALALDIAIKVAAAIAFMHALPTPRIHRDLHPGNVLLTEDLSVKLTDFGLSVAVDQLLRLAPAAGALLYQPPESVAMQEASPASDVYSLGLVMYEMVSARLPYSDEVLRQQGNARMLLSAKLNPVEPPSRNGNLELRDYPEFEEVMLRCLEPVSSLRYRDGSALLADLESARQRRAPATRKENSVWDRVRMLVEQAQGALRRNDVGFAETLALDAKRINDGLPAGSRVPVVYELLVDIALRKGDSTGAMATAQEGVMHRPSKVTFTAAARAFASSGHPAAKAFRVRAEKAGE